MTVSTDRPANPHAVTDWADDDVGGEMPAVEIITGPEGIKTIIEMRVEDGRKLKTTRKVKVTLKREKVNHAVAERKKWSKFGLERGKKAGPDFSTTKIGEEIELKLGFGQAGQAGQDANGVSGKGGSDMSSNVKDKLKNTAIKCRLCEGEHWTTRCPYKETLGGLADVNGLPGSGAITPGGSTNTSEPTTPSGQPIPGVSGPQRYVPPHLRGRMGGSSSESLGPGGPASTGFKREHNDDATLRVTNLREFITEDEIRELFRKVGHVQRVYLARDRESNQAKGFAFVSFADRDMAQRAKDKFDHFGWHNLIMRCEFSRPRE